ncbi:MAG: oligosaccharide flippase family protein [Deltaproteobacteria bacterium]|nr:oligosaccharide flippase family protein [Deltaproteobacteria bacterium]
MAPGTSTVRTILGNAGWLVLAEVLGRLLTIGAIAHLSRRLGPGPMGMVELGLGIFGFVSLVSLGGVEVLATRRTARTASGLGRLATTHAAVAWIWTLPALVVAAVFLQAFDHPPPTTLIAAGIGAAAILSPLGVRFAFQGRERMDALALASLLGQAVWACSVLLVVRDAGDVALIPALWLAGEVARVSLSLSLFGKRFGRIQGTSLRAVRAWIVSSAPVSVGRIAHGLVYFIDVLVLGLFAPLEVVGLYAVGLRLPLFLVTVAALGNKALFPSFARSVGEGAREDGAALMRATIPLMVSVGLAAAITLAVSGSAFLGVLFGAAYSAAAPWMAILVFRGPVAGLSGLYRMTLWTSDPGAEARDAVLATALMIALLFVLTPGFGPAGAASAMLLGELAYLLLYRLHSGRFLGALRLPTPWAVLQVLCLGGLGAWAWWVSGQSEVMTMVTALLAGAVFGFLPLLPQVRALRAALRRP